MFSYSKKEIACAKHIIIKQEGRSTMSLNKKRWIILVACCLINLCLGSIYSWSVFASAMADYLSIKNNITLTVADLAIVYTIANAISPVTMITGGWFNDKLGPKLVLLIGGTMFGVGMITSGFVNSVGGLIATYGIVSGLGMGMTYGTTVSTCVKYFPDKRGLIGGITTAVYGLSSVILPPVVTLIIQGSNAAIAFEIIGGIFLGVIILCALLVKKCPSDYVPEGWTPPAKKDNEVSNDKNWKGMLCTKEFYVMLILLTCGAFCGMMIIPHASAIATGMVGMELMAASTAVSVLALFNAAGRIVAGTVSDKIGRINTLAIACGLSFVGMICLYFTGMDNVVLFFVGIAIVGLCFGSFMGVFPGFTADQFGAKNNSVNYGIMFVGFALAGFFGPTIMKSIYESTGAYQNAFIVAGALSIFGIGLTFVYRLFTRKKKIENKVEEVIEEEQK